MIHAKYLGVSRSSRLLTRRRRLTQRWVWVWIIEPSSVWGDIRGIGETECVRSVGAEMFRRRGWDSKVSPNRTPVSAPTCLTTIPLRLVQQSHSQAPLNAYVYPTPCTLVPVDIDSSRKKDPTPITCYRCHQLGHKAPDCPLRFNIRLLTNEELENELMNWRDIPLAEILLVETESEVPKEKDFVQDNKWKTRPRCPLITVSKY